MTVWHVSACIAPLKGRPKSAKCLEVKHILRILSTVYQRDRKITILNPAGTCFSLSVIAHVSLKGRFLYATYMNKSHNHFLNLHGRTISSDFLLF